MTGRLVAVGVLSFGAGYLLRSWVHLIRCEPEMFYYASRLFAAEKEIAALRRRVADPGWVRDRYEGQLRTLEQELARQREVNEDLQAFVGEAFEVGRWAEREAMS